MGKIRVYDIAKELNMGNKELVQKLQEMGYPVKSHSSTIEEFLVKEIKGRLSGGKSQAVPETKSRPTVIRRRKKVVSPSIEEMAPGTVQAAMAQEEFAPENPVLEAVEPIPTFGEPAAGSEPMMEPTPEPELEPRPIIAPEAAPTQQMEVKTVEESVMEAPVEMRAPLEIPEREEPTVHPIEEISEVVLVEPEPQEVIETTAPEKAGPAVKKKAARKPGTKMEPKVKRIEKTTMEPARIISRPQLPVQEIPKPAPQTIEKRASKPKPEQRPRRRPTPAHAAKAPPSIKDMPREAPGAADTRKGKKKKKGKDGFTQDSTPDRKRSHRRREIIEKAELYDVAGWDRPGRGRKAARTVKKVKKTEITVPKAIKRRIKVVDVITVADLAKKMGIKSGDIIRQLMTMGVMANINQAIDFDTAALVATEFDYEVEKASFDEEEALHVVQRDDAEKTFRPPVVTVMGHVDHGKTSLLDAIRQTNVIEGEAGGITQHIGAYHVEVKGGRITFLDTPGHAAFTSMRARGAQITDIVILVVAADDGVMQQTREAADHAKAAEVPIIVAVNKIDKPEADTERIRREMSDLGLVPEAWGGDTIFVDLSAKSGQGINDLLDMILLQAELLELKATTDERAQGRIVEARLDKGRGPVATVLIQEGQLKQGDPYVCGVYHGKVRAMFDDKGQRVESAGPSIPIEIQGISGVPQAGDEFVAVEDDKRAKQVSQHRQLKLRETELLKTSKLTLETLFDSIKEGGAKELNLVLKADVQGSLEAISEALAKLATEDIKIHIMRSSTGAITESDIMLASASNALVLGFNVRPNLKVQELAEHETIQIRFYKVIYKLIDEIKEAMVGLLEPVQEERVLGRAEVREPFHVSKVGTIAGSSVTDGKVARGANARLLRDDVVIYDGKIESLKRFKDDVKEVLSGYECGIGLDNYNDIKAGDVIEAYFIEEVAATLD